MTTSEFTATSVYAGEDDEALTAGLADHAFAVTRYLTLQRSKDPSDGSLHIELNDQIRSCHGGVKSLVLYDGRCVVHLSEQAAQKLRTNVRIVVEIVAEVADVERLSVMLRRILGGLFEDRRRSYDPEEAARDVRRIYERYRANLGPETIEGVEHYLQHGEYEMAFEGLCMDLMRGELLVPEDIPSCLKLAKAFRLEEESVFTGNFWETLIGYAEVRGGRG